MPNFNEKMQIRISENEWIEFEQARDFPAWVSLVVVNEFVNWHKSKGLK